MTKIIALLNPKRQHFWNRLKLRGGKLFYFLFAKKMRYPPLQDRTGTAMMYRFKEHFFLIENNRLQTYIKKTNHDH